MRSRLLPFFIFVVNEIRSFAKWREDHQLDLTIIPDAGHNAFRNPTYFAEKIENIVLKIAQP